MHMTVAQSDDASSDAHRFLVDKVGLLPPIEWEVDTLYFLVREHVQLQGTATSQMKIWGSISISNNNPPVLSRPERPLPFCSAPRLSLDDNPTSRAEHDPVQTHLPYVFDDETLSFTPFALAPSSYADLLPPTTLFISTYNILASFTYPPPTARYPLLLSTILSSHSQSDILILQETTDSFLSFLLSCPAIQTIYPYSSHGPPSQLDIDPLPSFLNTIILSRLPFEWEYVSLLRKHENSLVAKFPSVFPRGNPLVVAAVHLSRGLTDGSVAARKTDVLGVMRYLREKYDGCSLVVAGDFNTATSEWTISHAVEKGAMSGESVRVLRCVEGLLRDNGLVDAWEAVRDVEGWEERETVGRGEEGATYDPTVNEIAADIARSGVGMRPQRFDRVLIRGEGRLRVCGFGMFGREKGKLNREGRESYPSDHWGIRAEVEVIGEDEAGKQETSEEIRGLVVPVEIVDAPEALAAPGSVEEALDALGVVPTEEEAARRKKAVALLESVLLEAPSTDGETASTFRPSAVVVPVGSYGLGVWTEVSDVDVLCIGSFSARTFFALATQRLRNVATQEVRILRRVKANTGTMLELEVLGIKMDLQYCQATAVAEQYPKVLRALPTDPVWRLSVPTLNKLKALRDMDYLCRSIPDLATFRLAHRFIKTWAIIRGIYSARFGYLGGIQISLLLARVMKLLPSPTPLASLLTTFFTHYTSFPWSTHLAFDPVFHRDRLPYTRTIREPLAILGYYTPALNTCFAASVPSTRTIASEFKLAATILTSGTIESWTSLLRHSGAKPFLAAFPTYIRLDVQYWGISPTRGRRFIGWLESRCVSLLVDLHRRAGGVLYARMWPSRWVVGGSVEEVEGMGEEEKEEGREYGGCYLIGVEKVGEVGKSAVKAALGGIRSALERFVEGMKGDVKYFDARSCWLAGAVVSRADLEGGKWVVDKRVWGELGDGVEEDDEEEEQPCNGLEGLDIVHSSGRNKKKKGKNGKVEETFRLTGGKKFRRAADVMNRIRWDPDMESGDYLVGYEDRFVGAREKDLESWKTEQTDEEFIPQHRILYFKRRSDGFVVWERRTRTDVIFGSGL